jgi:dTDP-4-dehydrorhamnose 3,5-epimerase
MDLVALPLAGAYAVTSARHEDERGVFSRIWDSGEFAAGGLHSEISQSSVSLSPRRGTLRGLHYQVAPHEEAKLVTCLRGSIWDVMVDLRPDSPTYRHWHAMEVSSENLVSVYVPQHFAHGYQTLEDDSLVLYEITAPYHAEASRGLRWDDPVLDIPWPETKERVISARDRSHPLLEP